MLNRASKLKNKGGSILYEAWPFLNMIAAEKAIVKMVMPSEYLYVFFRFLIVFIALNNIMKKYKM